MAHSLSFAANSCISCTHLKPTTHIHPSLRLQLIAHILSFAFIMVIASTALMTPLLLYVLGLKDVGWHWQHAALFSSMVAPTDAVAVSAILKGGERRVELPCLPARWLQHVGSCTTQLRRPQL